MASSDIVVTPVSGKSDLKAFIDLPKRLYAGHKGYIPHLDAERREAFTPGKNPLFGHVEVQFFLARRGGRVVGRIAAQVDRAYLERYADDTGHFGCLAAEDDPAIFAALFAAAESLAARQGPEAGDRPVQPLGQRGGRPAGLGLREPPRAAGALRPALCRGPRRSLRLRQAEGRLLLRLRRPERARDDRRQADGARRHGRPGQGAHRQHEDVRRRGPHPGRHLQRRLERQLGLRALHPGRDRPCLESLRAGDRARARGVRGGRRRGGGLHRGADQPQRGDRGVQRQARARSTS